MTFLIDLRRSTVIIVSPPGREELSGGECREACFGGAAGKAAVHAARASLCAGEVSDQLML